MNSNKDKVLAIATALIGIAAYLAYNWQVFQKQSIPNAASWGVWAFVTVLNFTSYKALSKDWVKSVLPTIGSALCIITFLFAGMVGRFNPLTVYDSVALAGGVIAGLAWWGTKSPAIAQVLLQISVGVGFVPTYLGVWSNPHSEKALAWVLWTISFSLQIWLVYRRKGEQADYIYPINCTALHALVVPLTMR